MKKTKKEILEKLIENNDELLQIKQIQERYLQREILINPKMQNDLGRLQMEIKSIQKFLEYLEEILKEEK